MVLSPGAWGHPFDPFAEEKQAARALIVEQLRAGDLHEALEQADAAIAQFPKHASFYALKAQILLRSNRSDEALATVQRALVVDTEDALSHWVRGLIYQQRSDYTRALADFTRALALDDDNPTLKIQATGNRGMVLVDLGRYSEALDDLNRAIEARPNAYAERQFRAQAYLATQRASAARTDIDALLQMHANDGYTQRLLGELQLAEGAPKLALKSLTRALALNTKDARAYLLRAQAHAALGELSARTRDLKMACDLGDRQACATLLSEKPK